MAMVIDMIGWNFQIHISRSTCQLTQKMLTSKSVVGKISLKEDISVGLLI